mmetsp:Transcript_62712/g.75453  ORF Transcript_62712/g.75453 Transcript_62712/m.75453 type:complete len:257 (-) Transcript_62712:343-1113(-)
MARISPCETGTFAPSSNADSTNEVISDEDPFGKVLFFSKRTEFWSRAESIFSGYITWCVIPSAPSAAIFINADETSCNAIISEEAYVFSRILSVLGTFFFCKDSIIIFFIGCHTDGVDNVFIMCTRMASKIAPHMVCNGIETFSSSSVIAGYFEFLMSVSILYGVFTFTPDVVLIFSSVVNMNFSHSSYHRSNELRSPSYILITVGLQAIAAYPSLPSIFIVLVILSGMEAKRLLPSILSFKNPEMMRRFLKSLSQ